MLASASRSCRTRTAAHRAGASSSSNSAPSTRALPSSASSATVSRITPRMRVRTARTVLAPLSSSDLPVRMSGA